MRPIRFRAWDEQYSTMHEWSELKTTIFREFDAGYYNFMQFTGLLDKNGVEIYEGDIIEWKSKPEYNDGYSSFKLETGVQFKEVMQVEWISSGFNLPKLATTLNAEVIGNIYENPELLTNK